MTENMRELQLARRLWLDAEIRALEAEARCTRLYGLIADMQQKMLQQTTQHMVDHIAAPWVALAAEIRRKL